MNEIQTMQYIFRSYCLAQVNRTINETANIVEIKLIIGLIIKAFQYELSIKVTTDKNRQQQKKMDVCK